MIPLKFPDLFKSTKFRPSKKSFGITVILFAVLLALAFCAKPVTLFFESLELRYFGFLQASHTENRQNSNITIIKIDDTTLDSDAMAQLFGRWPYRRNFYAAIIHFLNRGSLQKTGPQVIAPKVIAIDMQFGRPDQDFPQSDEALVNSIKAARYPVISVLIPSMTPPTSWQQPAFLAHLSQQQPIQVSNPAAIENVSDFFTNLTPPFVSLWRSSLWQSTEAGRLMRFYTANSLGTDPNGAVRFYAPFVQFALPKQPGQPLKTLIQPTIAWGTFLTVNFNGPQPPAIQNTAEGTLQVSGQKSDQNKVIHGHRPTDWIIRWFGDLRLKPVYKTVSAWDVVQSELALSCLEDSAQALCQKITPGQIQARLKPEDFKNQYVLLGITAQNTSGNADTHQSIYGHGSYPGIFVQANALDNILHDEFVRPAGSAYTLLAVVLLSTLAMVSSLFWGSILLNIAYVIVLTGVYTFITYWGYQYANLWINWVYPITALWLSFTGSYVLRYMQTEKRKQQLRFAFGKYVSPGVMQEIEKNPGKVRLGGQKRVLTMLFCDIRGFTSFSEQNPPDVVQAVLSEYFSMMNRIILKEYGGSINKLIGDAIMAYWGFPLSQPDDALRAVQAALKMKQAIASWQADSTRPFLDIGIGINTGEVMIGNVGSEDFMDFTVIGDAVNLASRLESENKTHQTQIIIAESTYLQVKDQIEARPLGSVTVRGKAEETQIYEPLGLRPFSLGSQ